MVGQFQPAPHMSESEARMAPPFVGSPAMTFGPDETIPPALASADTPFDDFDDEGIVEPVFEADVSEAALALAELSQAGRNEEFPLDAFIVPEQTQHIPSGLEGRPLPTQQQTPVTDLADRLEKLSHRLRVEETDIVLSRMASGDRLDALLAGLLAGYLAAK